MPELNFKGKEFVYNHHLSVPHRPLLPDSKKSVGEPRLDGNLIIHGDNLEALKSLLPMYAGQVDCVFIDPPYNTGKEEWSYNDNVNSPLTQQWLKDNPVGVEDWLRHDKWLCLIWPRLRLLHELLSETGKIFVCIDDNEIHRLRSAMDEIFGETNWLGTIVWKNVTDNNPTRIATEHEYLICYAKDSSTLPVAWKSSLSAVKDTLITIGQRFIDKHSDDEELQQAYSKWFKDNKSQLWPLDRYKYIDRGGVFTGSQSVHNPGREGYRYDVLHPGTGKPCQQPLMGYRFPPETMDELLKGGKVLFGEDHNKIIELKLYAHEFENKLPSVIELDGRLGSYDLKGLFPEKTKVFDHPKPVQLVEQILSFALANDGLVLDSFAGSGTTAHSTLKLNAEDNGNRRFILVECEDYADTVTRERVSRVINGVSKSKVRELKAGLGGRFAYCTLGDPVELDKILTGKSLPPFEQLGALLFHTATSEVAKIGKKVKEVEGCGYLGASEAYHVWLIYQPDLEFLKSRDAALTLTKAEALAKSKKDDRRHLVFAPARFVSQKLLDEQSIPVDFAPLPYALYRVERPE